jgi:hypothetical protein
MTSRLIPRSDVDPRHRLKAIGLMALATVCFAGLDSTAKYLVGVKGVPVAEVTWFRFAGHVVFSAVALWPFAFKALAPLGQASGADLSLRAHGGDHGFQLHRA